MTHADTRLTVEESFQAMVRFLEMYWERSQSAEIAMLLGSLTPLPDGKPADPALWSDWQECIAESHRPSPGDHEQGGGPVPEES